MGYIFVVFSDFLSQVVNLEPFLYAFAAMFLCAIVGLIIYIIRGDQT